MQTDHVEAKVWAVGFSSTCAKDTTALCNTSNAIERESKKGIVMPFALGIGVFTGKEEGAAGSRYLCGLAALRTVFGDDDNAGDNDN